MARKMARKRWRKSEDWAPILSRGRNDLNRHERRYRASRRRLFSMA